MWPNKLNELILRILRRQRTPRPPRTLPEIQRPIPPVTIPREEIPHPHPQPNPNPNPREEPNFTTVDFDPIYGEGTHELDGVLDRLTIRNPIPRWLPDAVAVGVNVILLGIITNYLYSHTRISIFIDEWLKLIGLFDYIVQENTDKEKEEFKRKEEEWKREKEDLKRDKEDLKRDKEELKREKEELKRSNEELKQKVDQYEAVQNQTLIQRIQNSWSWLYGLDPRNVSTSSRNPHGQGKGKKNPTGQQDEKDPDPKSKGKDKDPDQDPNDGKGKGKGKAA